MWKDTTSYFQGQEDRTPTTFTAKCGEIQITVTCSHRDYKPVWVMHCHDLGINTKPLTDNISAEEAQKMAVTVVREKLRRMMYDTTKILMKAKQ